MSHQRSWIRPIFVALLLFSLPGCVSLGRQYDGVPLPLDKLAQVKVGTTTRGEILSLFGPPSSVQRRELEGVVSSLAARYQGDNLTLRLDPALFNDIFVYEYRRVNRTAVLLLLFNYVQSVDRSDRVAFFFDAGGKVAGVGVIQGTQGM